MSRGKTEAWFHLACLSPALNNGLWVGKCWQILHFFQEADKEVIAHAPLGLNWRKDFRMRSALFVYLTLFPSLCPCNPDVRARRHQYHGFTDHALLIRINSVLNIQSCIGIMQFFLAYNVSKSKRVHTNVEVMKRTFTVSVLDSTSRDHPQTSHGLSDANCTQSDWLAATQCSQSGCFQHSEK